MTPDLEKIIERVRKMHAKAESAVDIGSVAEAEAFAEAVQKTLAAYKLDMSVLSIQQQDRQDPLGEATFRPREGKRSQKRVWWIEDLASIVARAHYCQILVYRGSDTLALVGRESDREVAQYMIVLLTRLATELCQQGYWKARYVAFKETGSYDTQDFKESFFTGFVNTISRRYYELREQQAKTPGMSVVLHRSGAEVQAFIAAKGFKKASSMKLGSAGNSHGYRAGVSAGNAAKLDSKGVKTAGPNKQLS